jgi:hypothetical protein
MEFQEKLGIAIKLAGGQSLLANALGVTRQRIAHSIKSRAQSGGRGFDLKTIEKYIANKITE